MVTQVHGAGVVEVAGDERPEVVERIAADALVTSAPGVALAVRTADCVPVLLAVEGPGVARVAAVHAGWRGVVAGVIPAAVLALTAGGLATTAVRASIGPAIDGCCFEVHPDVSEALVAATGRREIVIVRGPGSRPHVDLRRAARWSLLSAGLLAEHIDLVGPCTRCAASAFHSYRREGGGRGRQLSFVVISGDA